MDEVCLFTVPLKGLSTFASVIFRASTALVPDEVQACNEKIQLQFTGSYVNLRAGRGVQAGSHQNPLNQEGAGSLGDSRNSREIIMLDSWIKSSGTEKKNIIRQ